MLPTNTYKMLITSVFWLFRSTMQFPMDSTKSDMKAIPAAKVNSYFGNKVQDIPQTPYVLWNAMIFPLLNITIKGVIWYQGKFCLSLNWLCLWMLCLPSWQLRIAVFYILCNIVLVLRLFYSLHWPKWCIVDFQGEANSVYRMDAYNCSIIALVADWRSKFHTSSFQQTSLAFPFGIVQVI